MRLWEHPEYFQDSRCKIQDFQDSQDSQDSRFKIQDSRHAPVGASRVFSVALKLRTIQREALFSLIHYQVTEAYFKISRLIHYQVTEAYFKISRLIHYQITEAYFNDTGPR